MKDNSCLVFEVAESSTSSLFFFHGGGEGLPASLFFAAVAISIIVVAIIASALIVKKLVDVDSSSFSSLYEKYGREKKSDATEGDLNENGVKSSSSSTTTTVISVAGVATTASLVVDAAKSKDQEKEDGKEEEEEDYPITGNKWKELEQNCMNVGTAKNKKRIEAMLSFFLPSDEWKEHLNYKVEIPECPICFLPFPNDSDGKIYMTCCGVEICDGCSTGRLRSRVVPKSPPINNKGTRNTVTELDEFTSMVQSDMKLSLCPFCRAETTNDKEKLMRKINNRIDKHQDTIAMLVIGDHYRIGGDDDSLGLTKCLPKAKRFYEQAYELGNALAGVKLAEFIENEIELNTKPTKKKKTKLKKKRGKKVMRKNQNNQQDHYQEVEEENKKKKYMVKEYYTEAARRGSILAEAELADLAWVLNDKRISAKHSIRAARHGCESTMKNLFVFYKIGIISKKSLDETLRAHHNALNETKSESREYAKRFRTFLDKYKKETDEYGDWLPGCSPYDEVPMVT